MIPNLVGAPRRAILILLAASTVLVSPMQAQQTAQQPAAPPASSENSQVPRSAETIVAIGSGPVAAGDTVRWMIGDTISGVGATARVHILVKPVRPDITTNLIINTDRRTYHIELRANPSVYMASVSWIYPQDQLIALRQARAEAERAAPVAADLDLAALNFRYAIEGDRPDWRPLRAFDDGVRVFIEFPESVAQGELPPLFVIGARGEAELVNYRVAGRYMIVDRLFGAAELRLGGRKGQDKVRIIDQHWPDDTLEMSKKVCGSSPSFCAMAKASQVPIMWIASSMLLQILAA